MYLHWGTERQDCPDPQQVATAKALQRAGADVIVGSHAHRLQGGGFLGRSYVDYGLGNFVWWRSAEPDSGSGVLTVSVGRSAAVANGSAFAAGRHPTSTVVTRGVWTPLLIAPDGVRRPEQPAGGLTPFLSRARMPLLNPSWDAGAGWRCGAPAGR